MCRVIGYSRVPLPAASMTPFISASLRYIDCEMPRSGRHGWLRLAGLGLILIGCSQTPPPAFPEWVAKVPEFAPTESSSNAFDGYVLAAREAEHAAGDLAKMVSFDGRRKRELIEKLRKSLGLVRRAASKSCNYRFVPRPPFDLDPNYRGWRLIRLSLIWQIESAARRGDLDTVVSLTVLATKVGFDLMGGGARDADLGLQFVDDARRAVLPVLSDLQSNQLATLTNGLKRGLAAEPEFGQIVDNEKQSMLFAVSTVQQCYREEQFSLLEKKLGGEVRDAISYLKQLKPNDRSKRPLYFEGFAREAGQFADWYKQLSALPASRRPKIDDKERGLKLAPERPWRRFSKQFFTALDPIQSKLDVSIARTRLMILTSEILRQIKVARRAPKTLGGFSRELTLDTFTGQPFVYQATGTEFKLYGMGENYQDDLGNSDSIGMAPDLILEPVQP